MEASRILVARRSDLAFVKVVGRGSFQTSVCLKSFYQQLLKDSVTKFVIDLEACNYLDSTFLGTLLQLGLALQKLARPGVLHVVHANARNVEVMSTLGLDQVFKIEQSLPVEADKLEGNALKEVPSKPLSREEAAPTILSAHELLMQHDTRNVPKFKDVVEFLREDLKQHTRCIDEIATNGSHRSNLSGNGQGEGSHLPATISAPVSGGSAPPS